MTHDNKNFILAIVLSVAIIFGYQYFLSAYFTKPAPPQQTQQQTTTNQQTGQAQLPPGVAPSAQPPAQIARDAAIAASKRVPIDSPVVEGSINLTGGLFDDLHLKLYRETVDPKSPEIALLNPTGTEGAYFAEQGWLPAAGSGVKGPDPLTVWSAPEGAVLSPGKPVTISWDNGAGLLFTRRISIDDDYVFTIDQEVENRTQAPAVLYPYSRIERQGTP